MPLSLSELKEMERHLPSRNVKSEEDKVISNEVGVEGLKPDPIMKMCPNCALTKPLNMFHVDKSAQDGHVKFCKVCATEKQRIKSEIKAKTLFKKEIIPFSKHQKMFTVKDIWEKIGSSESTAWAVLKVLVTLGFLNVQKKGVTNWYEIAVPEDIEDEPVEKDESVFTFNTETGKDEPKMEPEKITVKTGCNGYDCISEALPEPKGIIKATLKEPVILHSPEESIIQTVQAVYNNAESIQITPESHEIHIKMKG